MLMILFSYQMGSSGDSEYISVDADNKVVILDPQHASRIIAVLINNAPYHRGQR